MSVERNRGHGKDEAKRVRKRGVRQKEEKGRRLRGGGGGRRVGDDDDGGDAMKRAERKE